MSRTSGRLGKAPEIVTTGRSAGLASGSGAVKGPLFANLLALDTGKLGVGQAPAGLNVGTGPHEANVVANGVVVPTWAEGGDLASQVGMGFLSTKFFLEVAGTESMTLTKAQVTPSLTSSLNSKLVGPVASQLKQFGLLILKPGSMYELTVAYDCASPGDTSL